MTAVLITGATGKQGGSVVQNLLAQNASFDILAVTRRADSSAAQKLAQQSTRVKIVEGNLDDPAAIFENAKSKTSSSIWGVFSVQVRIQLLDVRRTLGADRDNPPKGRRPKKR